MRERRVSFPDILLIAATRGMIGFGAGLLVSERLGRSLRKRVGWVLLATGVLSTIPLWKRVSPHRTDARPSPIGARRPAEGAHVTAD